MAFKISSTTQANIEATGNPDQGSYLASDGVGGSFWVYPGSTATAGQINNNSWEFRTIYTHGFLAGGYKGSNPWRTVNQIWFSTETTRYCGEQIAYTQGYTNGFWSDHAAYIIAGGGSGDGGGFDVTTSVVCSYSLHTGTIRTFSLDGFSSVGVTYGYSGNDPKNQGLDYGTAGYGGDVGGMRMSQPKLDGCATQNIIGQDGYYTGGGDTSTQKMHFPTEVMYTTTASATSGRGDSSYGETKAWVNSQDFYSTMTFSNDSYSTGGWGGWTGRDYQCKMLGSKKGHFYFSPGSNVSSGIAKLNQTSVATISTFNKVRAYGEANYCDGQDNGYCLGHYDGQQNNHAIRQSYSSDTQTTLGAAAQPKGHYGQSSGACSTGAATITALTTSF